MEHISVVISGFDPYEGVEHNPSFVVPQALAEAGPGAVTDGYADQLGDVRLTMHAVNLPVSFDQAWPRLKAEIDRRQADIVIATGLKRAARGILLERCATNLIDTLRPDATGKTVGTDSDEDALNRPIDPDGPAAFWTRLPLRSILDDFGAHHIPSALSSDAGTFVCNSLFYGLMKWAAAQPKALAGFVSLPIITEEAHSQHGLALGQQIEACRAVVRQTVRYYVEPSSSGILLA